MLIDSENPATYPTCIKTVIYQYIADNLTSVEAHIKENTLIYDSDVRCAVEDYLCPVRAERLYQKLLELMCDNEMICYHATKMLNYQEVLQNGLKVNEWDEYSGNMGLILKTLGVTNINTVIECIHKEYERKYGVLDREPQLCFFSGWQMLNNDGRVGYDQFCQNIGGELARLALKDKMPKVYNLLKNNGEPIIIKFKLPFYDIAEHRKDIILYQFVCYYAAKYFWNWDYRIKFDGATNNDIASSQVLDIIKYGQDVSYE